MAHSNLIDWNAVTLGAVAKSRAPVYPGPRLLKGKTKRSAQVKKGAEAERERRKGTRELYEELSQYYLLPAKMWGTPELLLKGKRCRNRSSI